MSRHVRYRRRRSRHRRVSDAVRARLAMRAERLAERQERDSWAR